MILDFLKSKGIGWFVSLGTCVLALVFLIIYAARGGDAGGYSPVSGAAVAITIIGIVANIGILIKDFKIGAFVPFIFYIITFGILMNTEMAFLSNVGFGVDGSYVDGGFIAMCVFLALTIVASIVAIFFNFNKTDSASVNA